MHKAFAPAKINLALHITGIRDDGYHLLDSLVAFADIGDALSFEAATHRELTISGPFANGVPTGPENLIWKALDVLDPGLSLRIHLEKNLPHPAGIGGGSSDAGAVLREVARFANLQIPANPARIVAIGADIPVCVEPRTARMRGVGEIIEPIYPPPPPLPAVLVNPGLPTPTGQVFKTLISKQNPPMAAPDYEDGDLAGFLDWLARQRNDLEAPARTLVPEIGDVLDRLAATPGCNLARMSGSGATCFGLFQSQVEAARAAENIEAAQPTWWVKPVMLANPG